MRVLAASIDDLVRVRGAAVDVVRDVKRVSLAAHDSEGHRGARLEDDDRRFLAVQVVAQAWLHRGAVAKKKMKMKNKMLKSGLCFVSFSLLI